VAEKAKKVQGKLQQTSVMFFFGGSLLQLLLACTAASLGVNPI